MTTHLQFSLRAIHRNEIWKANTSGTCLFLNECSCQSILRSDSILQSDSRNNFFQHSSHCVKTSDSYQHLKPTICQQIVQMQKATFIKLVKICVLPTFSLIQLEVKCITHQIEKFVWSLILHSFLKADKKNINKPA